MVGRKGRALLALCLSFGWLQSSCGLPILGFISPIDEPLSRDLNGTSDITLHLSEISGVFTHFSIFYRIYLSSYAGPPIVATDHGRQNINSQLAADHSALRLLADHTNPAANTAHVRTMFINTRHFLELELELVRYDDGEDGEAPRGFNTTRDVLGDYARGRILQIDFADIPGRPPRLTLRGEDEPEAAARPFIMRRAWTSGHDGRPFNEVNPLPETFVQGEPGGPQIRSTPTFLNFEELHLDRQGSPPYLNADVANVVPNSTRAFVMMYLVATGAVTDSMPPTIIFSQPTFLGIFQLPQP